MHEIKVKIPAEWEKKWKRLLKISGMSEQELILDLIRDEVETITTKREKESYDRMEDAAREVHKSLGAEGLEKFSQEVQLLAKKLIEAMSG